MPGADTSILLQTLGGTWEWVGSDSRAGIWHEGLVAEADEWGPSKASFTVRRDPSAMFPDLGAFTPVDILAAGVPVWSGRIAETPTRDGSDRAVNVQAEGWQYHLDDDQFVHQYVHSNLSDYVDQRSRTLCDLTQFKQGGNVTTGRGGIVLGWNTGATVENYVGVALDLGVGSTASRMTVTWDKSPGVDASISFAIVASNAPAWLTTSPNSTALSVDLFTATVGTNSGTFSTPYRYVHIYLLRGGAFVAAKDYWLKITAMTVYGDTTYESGDASILKASTIIPDALSRATSLLSTDRTAIATSTFSFPSFGYFDPKTSREVWNACNAAEDKVSQIDVYRRPIFAAKPTVAALEIGDWSAATFEDASANSGQDIYNRALVSGTTPDGLALIEERSAGQQAGAQLVTISSPSADNPSFATNTTSWTASSGTTITRDTGVFDTTPASGAWARAGGLLTGDTLTETFTGTFRAGVAYRLTFVVRGAVANGASATGAFGVTGDAGSLYISPILIATWRSCTISWTPTADRTTATLVLRMSFVPGAVTPVYVDSLALATTQPTLVDRRGFRRSKTLTVNNPLTEPLGDQLGDTFLAGHKTTPLKGTVKATGRQAIRDILTGQHIPPERMLLHTMKLLRLSHRTDPDTGGLHRDGRIINARVDFEQATVDLALDNSRDSFDALLSRLAIVIGDS